MEVSKGEYFEAIESNGGSLQLSKKVSKTAFLTSRLMSVFIMSYVGILFYYTDYVGLTIASEQLNFVRLLALIIGLGSIANLMTNFDRIGSQYPKVILLLLLSVYSYWQFSSAAGVDVTLLLFPAFLAIGLSAFYALSSPASA